MELWIRSQDRLGNYKSNSQVIREIGHEDKTTEFIILNENKISELLGTYKTKERALEVLDEIQDELISTSTVPIFNNEKITCGCARVYEMPKE